MNLKELRKISKKMLATFVDAIGLDGEYYANSNNVPMIFHDIIGLRTIYEPRISNIKRNLARNKIRR